MATKTKGQAKCYVVVDGLENRGVVHAFTSAQAMRLVKIWAAEQNELDRYYRNAFEVHEKPTGHCTPAVPHLRCSSFKIGVANGAHFAGPKPATKTTPRARGRVPAEDRQAEMMKRQRLE